MLTLFLEFTPDPCVVAACGLTFHMAEALVKVLPVYLLIEVALTSKNDYGTCRCDSVIDSKA